MIRNNAPVQPSRAFLNSGRAEAFRAGQVISAETLKGLQDFALARDALLSTLLIGSDGVCEGILESFEMSVDPSDPLSIRVGAGAAITKSGDICIHEEPTWISLREVTMLDDATFIVQVQPVEHSEAPTEVLGVHTVATHLIPSIRRFGAVIRLVQALEKDGVEVGRVRVGNKVETIGVIRDGQAPSDFNGVHGTVDCRFVRQLRPRGLDVVVVAEIELLREAVKEFRAACTKVDAVLGPLKRWPLLHQTLVNAQAEISESAPSPAKMKFFWNELRSSTLDFFEDVRAQLSDSSRSISVQTRSLPKETWDQAFESILAWESVFHSKTLNKERGYCQALAISTRQLTAWIMEKLLHSEVEKERWVLIGEHLEDMRHKQMAFHDKQVFGGELFTLSSGLDHEGLKRSLRTQVAFETQKTFTARYLAGGQFQGTGLFYSEGVLSLPITDPELNGTRDAVVVLRLYKRMAQSDFSIQWNGTTILHEKMPADVAVNAMVHVGCFIPRELIGVGGNEVRIQIHKVDLDFGVTGLWVYRT